MSGKKLNILFLSSWYPSKAISTLGNFVQRHAEAVATLHTVRVLYVTFLDNIPSDYLVEDEEINGVQTTKVYCRRGIFGSLSKRNAFKKGIEHLRKEGRFHFDLVHHNITWNAGWQARYLYRKFGLPYIITEHWTGYDISIRNDQPMGLRPFSRFVVAKAAAICPVTANLGEVMRRYGLNGNYKVVPNVVDTSIFHLEKKDDSLTRFLHVSTLDDAHKNIRGILHTWKKLSDANSNIHLTIGGDGPHQFYHEKARSLGIRENSITFFGEKKWHEIATLMQQSHCLLLFSNYENLPCVIVEALASGMAVISTDVGGISEHINASRGFLVKKGDEEGLYQAVSSFIAQRGNFVPTELRQYAELQFSIPAIASAFDKVYQAAVRRG